MRTPSPNPAAAAWGRVAACVLILVGVALGGPAGADELDTPDPGTALSASGRLVTSKTCLEALNCHDLTGKGKPFAVKTGMRNVDSLAITPDGSLAAVAGSGGVLVVRVGRKPGVQSKFVLYGYGGLDALALSPDG